LVLETERQKRAFQVCRAALLLHDVEGLSGPEVAETLSRQAGHGQGASAPARLFLRTRLGEYMGEMPGAD